ncbi:MAG: minor coat protein [Inoviridae sp.]|nr:MAG: minor coat protein [Inoviridae sp.]
MPVIAGLPWLASVLGGLFGGLVNWLAQFVTRKLALLGAALVAITSLTTAFVASMEALILGLGATFPGVGYAWQLFVPDNFSAVIAVTLSAKTIWWVYQWNIKIVQLRLF